MGKPTILVEIGQNGSRDEAHVAAIVAGVENALAILGMSDAPHQSVPAPLRLFEGTTAVTARTTGVYHPADPRPRPVAKGELVGVIRDYTGAETERLYAPVSGYALYGISGPAVEAGDALVTIGLPVQGF